MNMDFKRKLPIPKETKEMYPLDAGMAEAVHRQITELEDVIAGRSDRLAVIIGPCSADNEDSVLDYVNRLATVQEKVKDRLLLIPRIYTSKPRTTGDGYKGILHQPDSGAEPDLFNGIIAMRSLQMRVVKETGMAGADELLYPENYKYVDDLLGYVAIGARSVEDQQHRMIASATDCPVGMKNPTGGDLIVMMNSIYAAQQEHDFIYRGWEGHSFGNQYAHAILRGFVDGNGELKSNYSHEYLDTVAELYSQTELKNQGIIIDCNHANSGKDPFKQPEIVRDVIASMQADSDISKLVKGFMIESYIEDGCQPVGGNVYGQSITDACLGWEKSEKLIYEIAELCK